MQLKGLVRFFTIVLILISLYELSFTWLVRSHEGKLRAKAEKFVKANNPNAAGNSDSFKFYVDKRFAELADSTGDKTLSYGFTGAISYDKAKQEELNLGLDLQGGMSVTMEVELMELIKSMTNGSKDPVFNKALEQANAIKANSSGDYVSIFRQEYERLAPNGRLAPLFSAANPDKIKPDYSNGQVESAIRTEAKEAFNRTFGILEKRIDQFGVAQPAINKDADKGIINVELPGIQDEVRVKQYLQSTANLQFWEVYTLKDQELSTALGKANDVMLALESGKPAADTTTPKNDTSGVKKDSATAKTDSAKAGAPSRLFTKLKITGQPTSFIGVVDIRDTGSVMRDLRSTALESVFPKDLKWMFGVQETNNGKKDRQLKLYAIRTNGKDKAEVEGDMVTDASYNFDQFGKIEITMKMNSRGRRAWGDMTTRNVNKPIAITLDNRVYSAPNVNEPILDGSSRIQGEYTLEQAQDFSGVLKVGKLPAPAKIVSFYKVGPTLGQDSINGGFKSFMISFVVIFLLMLVYYNTSGWIANIALILNLLFTIGGLIALGATLTAPGIAGLVLTIGMAVDTNVIIYERIKEELTRGKSYLTAVNEGYKRSLPPVLDAHVTTFLTAIILFYFGLGPVKGFATTQMIGIVLSLFCGILVSRWVTEWFTNKNRHLEYFTNVSRRVFKHASYKFIEYRKVAYAISVVVLLLGVAAYFNGFHQGVEFKGGRSFVIEFKNRPDISKVREDLSVAFNKENTIIKTSGNDKTLDITTSFLINDTTKNADATVEQKLFEGLKSHLPQGTTYERFDSEEFKKGTKKITPSISDALKKGAVKATVISILIIMLYIFIRFRDWRYSLGTIIALLHDVFITLIVFSFFKNIVPFPLEIDQHFIAAILTVIGFSMNDTVIVFDRIREYSKHSPGMEKGAVINRAINDTLSRTIMTSLTVFLTILILFIFGGEVTRGFAFAMLIGVVTGTYSSIFVAAPILVDFAKNKPLGKADFVSADKPAPAPKKS